MAKPLGPKSSLIRDAIKANPKVGNTELAKMINSSPARKEDRIRVEPNDIAKQRQALKKAKPSANQAGSKNGRRKANGRKGGRPRAAATASAQGRTAAKGAAAGGPVDLLDRVFGLAQECGGFGALKQHLRHHDDGALQIVKVVGNATGQLPEALQLAAAKVVFVGEFEICDVNT